MILLMVPLKLFQVMTHQARGYFGSKRLRVEIEVEVEDDQFMSLSLLSLFFLDLD
jgi:hypothetical protein